MKKTFTILMTLVLLFAMAVPVLAADSVQMTVSMSQSTANPGETIDFTVSISQVDDCRSGGFVVSYDSAVFEYVSGKCLVSGAVISDFSGGTGVFAFSEGVNLSGELFQFTLKIRSNAPVGNFQVSGKPSIRTGAGQISCGISGAQISVRCDHTYGSWERTADNHHRTCNKCGTVEVREHTWDEGMVTKTPSCKDEGIKSMTCSVCGAISNVSIDKVDDHTWGSCETVDDSTHKYVCTLCGTESVSGHSWDAGRITKEPTCKDSGVMTYDCTACTATGTDSIAKTDNHTWGSCVEVDVGTHKYFCSVCGEETLSSHNWNAGVVTKNATCSNEGAVTYTCESCGADYEEVIPVTDTHNWTQYRKKSDAKHTRTCTVCGRESSGEHTWDAGHITKEPTCKEAGVMTYDCQICGASATEPVEKTDTHVFDHACDPECNVCGKTREIAHSYENSWEWNDSHHWHACQICGAADDPLSHTFENECDTDCAACDFIRQPAHFYGTQWFADENGHWQVCSCCGTKMEAVPHIPGEEATETASQYCTVCGLELVPSLGHCFAETWSCDEDNHWHECACGEQEEIAAHIWDEGTENQDRSMTYACTICDAVRTEEAEENSGLGPVPLVVALIGIGSGAAVWFFRKKNL